MLGVAGKIGRRGPASAPRSRLTGAGADAVMAARSVTLGIDLGTTSVKAALVEAAPGDPSGFVVLASCARAAQAETAAQSAAAGPQVRQLPGAAPPPGASGHPLPPQ